MFKDLLVNPWYAAILAFVTQIAFLYFRTLNVFYTIQRNMFGAIWTNNMLSISWLLSMSIGINSMIIGDWQPITAFLLGGSIGTYWGLKKKI